MFMQSFITDKAFTCSIKNSYGSLKNVSAKYKWCLTFDAVYSMKEEHDIPVEA